MKATTSMVVLAALCLLCACKGGAETETVGSPQAAVVEWLDAVDGGDFQAAAEMAPPTLNSEEKEELAQGLEGRLGGMERDESSPFAMSDIESSSAEALVRLKAPRGEMSSVRLSLTLHDGQWYVMPEEPSESR